MAAFLPLTLAVIAIVLALALTALLGEGLTVSVFAINIITAMGFAVGIDYIFGGSAATWSRETAIQRCASSAPSAAGSVT